jgi:hypothetical protein
MERRLQSRQNVSMSGRSSHRLEPIQRPLCTQFIDHEPILGCPRKRLQVVLPRQSSEGVSPAFPPPVRGTDFIGAEYAYAAAGDVKARRRHDATEIRDLGRVM